MANRGLTGRLGRELLRQAFYISVAVLLSMFAVGLMVEDVLIEQALEGEADYYWQRVAKGGDENLPDTQNLTVYRAGVGEGVPQPLADLEPGFHRRDTPRETIVYVSERNGERIYLQFESEQVDELVLIFGTVPLALALIIIYVSTWLAYRVSLRPFANWIRPHRTRISFASMTRWIPTMKYGCWRARWRNWSCAYASSPSGNASSRGTPATNCGRR